PGGEGGVEISDLEALVLPTVADRSFAARMEGEDSEPQSQIALGSSADRFIRYGVAWRAELFYVLTIHKRFQFSAAPGCRPAWAYSINRGNSPSSLGVFAAAPVVATVRSCAAVRTSRRFPA